MARVILTVALFSSFALVAACAPQLRGDVSYDPDALYRNYKTVAWVEGQGMGTDEIRAIAEKAVTAELVKDGLSFVDDRSSADLLVRINHGRGKRAQMSGMAGSGTQKVGMEVILIDRKSGDWVWNGWAAETYENKLDAAVEVPKALELIFKDFPPTS